MIPVKAILDASPIIAFFAEIREPRILLLVRQLGYSLLVPEAVLKLDVTKEPSKTGLAECITSGLMTALPAVNRADLQTFMVSHPSLGEGESEVILVASQFASRSEEVICVIDEGPARRVAKQMGLPVTGTIGILRMLQASELITTEDLARLKGKLKASGFRADASLL